MRCFNGLTALLVVAWMMPLPGRAALPDPVRFGVAIEAGDADAARYWLDEGLAPDFTADRIGSGLMIAAWEGDVPMMELFLSRGARIDATNRHGEQALQLAAWKGHLTAVQWLLDHGAEINRTGKEWGALHYAAFAGNKEIVSLLIRRGADINARVPNGSTALMMTAHGSHEELAKLLLNAGADPKLVNERGDTALSWAMRYGNLRIAKLVASADEFAAAVKAPSGAFGAPRQSLPPLPQFEDILRQIRLAQAEGLPPADLRKALFDAIAQFKQDAKVVKLESKRKKASTPKALVITARRAAPGEERAEIQYGGTPGEARALHGESDAGNIAQALRRLQAAQAAGRPTAELRKAFLEAVASFRSADPELR